MRIAVVNNFYPPRAGGSAHLSEGIARMLVARGHEVLVLTGTPGEAPDERPSPGYRIVRFKSWTLPKMKFAFNFDINFAASPTNVKRLFALLDDFHPDVIHQHGQFFDLTFASSWYARQRKVPVVLTVHTRLHSPSSRIHDFVFRLGDALLVRPFIALSKPHVVVTDRLMDTYIAKRYGIPANRMTPIPIATEPEEFINYAGGSVRHDLGLDDRPVVSSLGHVIPLRDRLALVESIPLVLRKQPETAFLIIGGVYDDRFIRRATELGVAESLIITGAIKKDEVLAHLAAADVEAHDLSGFGLGIADLEAMAFGIPTIVAVEPDVFHGVELRSGENILLVRPNNPVDVADAILKVISDPELRTRIVAGQQELVRRHFSLESVTDKHEALFQSMISS